MAEIRLAGVSKLYPDGYEAVKDLNLAIADGEFMILVGPSGCGKSTVLRMLAGLEDISDGEMLIDGERVNDFEPRARDVAMVFQNYALYPHMTVRDNMAFGLRLAKTPGDEIDRRVTDAARILDLQEHLDRKPAQLSGGQRQRVAMGRAIVREPKVFLMDEPLSNLDAKLRVQMRIEVARIQKRLRTTTVYVTHDQAEALTLGDRVVVMRGGVVQQVESPQALYDDPANLFVAGFIGSPPMSFLGARVQGDTLQLPFGEVPLARLRHELGGADDGRELVAGVRPEHFEDASMHHSEAAQDGLRLRIVPTLVESLGSDHYVYFDVAARAAGAEVAAAADAAAEATARAGRSPISTLGGDTQIVARVEPASQAGIGREIELALDPAHIRLFDPGTGLSLAARS